MFAWPLGGDGQAARNTSIAGLGPFRAPPPRGGAPHSNNRPDRFGILSPASKPSRFAPIRRAGSPASGFKGDSFAVTTT